MVKPDWSASERSFHPPGDYLVRVSQCELKKSKTSGAQLFNVRLVAEQLTGEPTLCFDTIMLEGKGASIGCAKLEALGFDRDSEMEAADLVGRRAWVRVKLEEYQGKTNLKVATTFEPTFECGYWPEDERPGELPTMEGDEVPF